MKNETKLQTESKSMVDNTPAKVVSISKPPDPEVPEKKPRRRFTTAYKLRILKEYDACTKPGTFQALYSMISDSRNQWGLPSSTTYLFLHATA
ncbi:MAG: hypothetical protein L3J03_06655 [Desulfobacterales bacterium]|nr:hypothetical protein [Desulfobacterales bacterium]